MRRPPDPRSRFRVTVSYFCRASSGALGPCPGVGDPGVVTRAPDLLDSEVAHLACPRFFELESLGLVIRSGEKFQSSASAVTRRPRADTRGRRFNVLQPGILEVGADVQAGWETSSLQPDGAVGESEGVLREYPFSLSPWVQSGVHGAPRPGPPFPLCKINYGSSCRVFFTT